jgi:methylated-DNA-[protein]-cysteine S-methyltransferase
MHYDMIESQFGPIVFSCDEKGINRIQFLQCKKPNPMDGTWHRDKDNPVLKETGEQLTAYFSGKLKEFSIPLSLNGTDFQIRVWNALVSIPYGVTWSYKQLATHIGNPAACRAVGGANAKNILSLVVP